MVSVAPLCFKVVIPSLLRLCSGGHLEPHERDKAELLHVTSSCLLFSVRHADVRVDHGKVSNTTPSTLKTRREEERKEGINLCAAPFLPQLAIVAHSPVCRRSKFSAHTETKLQKHANIPSEIQQRRAVRCSRTLTSLPHFSLPPSLWSNCLPLCNLPRRTNSPESQRSSFLTGKPTNQQKVSLLSK